MEVVVALLPKLQERCPLKYAVIRNPSSLSSNGMFEEKEISTMKFQVLAERLLKLKWLMLIRAYSLIIKINSLYII